MKIASSILDLEPKNRQEIEKIYNSGIDLLHIDVMDGKFVPNYALPIEEVSSFITKENIDVHLMVTDVKKYVDEFCKLNPKYITFHYECGNVEETIKYIKNKGIKVGLSIKPNTSVEVIKNYLKDIDLVLIMSVEPGYGGQKFMVESIIKIKQLRELRKQKQYQYEIQVDGGINNDTIALVNDVDIVVVGSYISKSDDYKKQVTMLREIIK